MKIWIAYLLAILLHVAVFFILAESMPASRTVAPKKHYIEITLSAEPVLPEPTPTPLPPPNVEPPPEPPPPPAPEPETTPPPPPKTEDVLPELNPVPPTPVSPSTESLALSVPPAPVVPVQTEAKVAPVAALPAPGEYLNLSQPSFLSRVEPEYPLQSRRQHQQGDVQLGLYINTLGLLDKVEVVKTSGHPLLDQAAVDAVKQSRFHPAYQDKTPVPSHAEVTISFRLE